MTTSTTPTVVLVHGAFADASGFGGVIRELQAEDGDGLEVLVNLSQMTVSQMTATTRRDT